MLVGGIGLVGGEGKARWKEPHRQEWGGLGWKRKAGTTWGFFFAQTNPNKLPELNSSSNIIWQPKNIEISAGLPLSLPSPPLSLSLSLLLPAVFSREYRNEKFAVKSARTRPLLLP